MKIEKQRDFEHSAIRVIRSVANCESELFLTFDDGPDEFGTPAVLDLLKKLNCYATFFLIAEKAQQFPTLVARIQQEGHAIGNHSLNHNYAAFFASQKTMDAWLQSSIAVFEKLNIATVGFRPPAGVRTPALHRGLARLKVPLIMWNRRFFDTTIKFTEQRALRSLRTTPAGSVILLHDRQRPNRLHGFLQTLEVYISQAKSEGFKFTALTAADCE